MKQLFEIGEKVTLTVVAVQAGTVFLNLNAKSEGVLDADEVLDKNGKCTVKAGDKITAYYIGNVAGEDKFTTRIASPASRGGAEARGEGLAILERAFEKGIPVEGKVEGEIKGGYEVTLGAVRAFCPFSQAGALRDRGNDKDTSDGGSNFVGRTLAFRITEMRDSGKSIVVSRRAIEDEEKASLTSQLSGKVHVGDTVKGTVSQIREFGAFVDIGGFEALLPISEIARERVEDVSKYLSAGKQIKVKVIGCDWGKSRVSVSLKALLRDPWDDAATRYKEGTKHDGVVTRTAPYGVFVELESGLEGLMHISTIEGLKEHTNIAKVFRKGDKVSCKVLDIDTVDRRISLAPTTSEVLDRDTERYMARQSGGEDTYNPFAALLKR